MLTLRWPLFLRMSSRGRGEYWAIIKCRLFTLFPCLRSSGFFPRVCCMNHATMIISREAEKDCCEMPNTVPCSFMSRSAENASVGVCAWTLFLFSIGLIYINLIAPAGDRVHKFTRSVWMALSQPLPLEVYDRSASMVWVFSSFF